MSVPYKYSELNKPITFTEHSFARQVSNEPEYEKTNMPTESDYILTPCIP